MAAGLTSTRAAVAIDAIDADTWVQLHTGSPGAAGNANISATTTRKQLTWSGDNPRSNAGSLVWDPMTADEVISFVSGWSAESGGTCGWTSDELSSDAEDRTVAAGDRFTIATGDLQVTMPVAS